MKTLITFCLIMATTFVVYAQTLNGVSQFNVGTCFTSVDWEVSYSFQMVPEGVAIQFYNPRITVSSSSDYYTKGQRYSKQSLGLSSWPDENQNPQNMVISFTVSHIDGYGNYITSQPCNNGKFAPTIVLRKSNVKNWENISINSFRVISTERMMYNNMGSIKVDNIIEAKKNNSNNNTQSSTNASGHTSTSNAATTTAARASETKSYELKLSDIGIPESNSSATSEWQQNYQLGQDIGNTIVGIASLFGPSPEELARREREANLRAEREEAANRARVEKTRVISSRKELIKKYPDGKTPLSFEAKNVSQVYFFVYSYKESTIENDNSTIYISNVFTLPKYADGTWPFKTSLMEKIAKENQGLDLILSGYYENKNEADKQQYFFVSHAKSAAFNIQSISYEIKKTSGTSNSQTDFWGNSNKDAESTSTTKDNSAATDFWGNPIKSTKTEQNIPTIKKQDSIKPKVKVDFWGNPIKE